MKDYKKMSCVACGEPYDDKSDIVVCPECGAPHHRECWKETGHCACEELHSEDYEWQPEKIYIGDTSEESRNKADPGSDATGRVRCPNCGRMTKKSEKYCEYCGYYMYREDDPFSEKDMDQNMEELFPFDKSESINGVPAGDVKRFVGNMWIYYIPRFIKMARSKSPVSFNFTAFLTHGLWFISRKMYLPGILMMTAVTGISIFQAYFSNIAQGLSERQLALASMISLMLSGIEFVLMIVSGLFGNRLYMNYCAKKIKKINAQATAQKADADQFNRELESSGGVAMLPVFSVGLCYLAIVYIVDRGFFF